MRLKDKVAVITGGGTGIGRATAILFAREGARVVVVGRRLAPIQESVRLMEAQGGQGIAIPMDVSQSDQVLGMVDAVMTRYGKIDILFNNAATFEGAKQTILEMSEVEWDHLLAVNLKSVFLCSKYVIPRMIQNGGGVVVNCSSISGHVGQKRHAAYNAAKGGIELLTKCMALDFAEHNIRVNAVAPGWVEVEHNADYIRKHPEEVRTLDPIGRIGRPEDIAQAVLYLSSGESSWVTGSSLIIDGGYTAQ